MPAESLPFNHQKIHFDISRHNQIRLPNGYEVEFQEADGKSRSQDIKFILQKEGEPEQPL